MGGNGVYRFDLDKAEALDSNPEMWERVRMLFSFAEAMTEVEHYNHYEILRKLVDTYNEKHRIFASGNDKAFWVNMSKNQHIKTTKEEFSDITVVKEEFLVCMSCEEFGVEFELNFTDTIDC